MPGTAASPASLSFSSSSIGFPRRTTNSPMRSATWPGSPFSSTISARSPRGKGGAGREHTVLRSTLEPQEAARGLSPLKHPWQRHQAEAKGAELTKTTLLSSQQRQGQRPRPQGGNVHAAQGACQTGPADCQGCVPSAALGHPQQTTQSMASAGCESACERQASPSRTASQGSLSSLSMAEQMGRNFCGVGK